MKLNDYKLEHWNGKLISKRIDHDNFQILLLEIDKTQMPHREGYQNLIAVDKNDDIIWTAPIPDQSLYSSYEAMDLSNSTLQALSGSYMCLLDPMTGNILKQTFVK